jgi:hypothetical protein
MVNLRKVLELEYHNYLTSPPTRARHVYKSGGSRAAPLQLIETKILNISDLSGELRDEVEILRRRDIRGTLVVKITWDARQVSKDKHQVEMMLLIIPEGDGATTVSHA